MASMFVPQLVTPVDTSFLSKLGNTIGTLKQDSEIASIMKGIDPYDPNSKQRVISDLRVHGSREARDMADRLEGLDIRRQTAAQQGEYQKGQLDVARGRLGLEERKYGEESAEKKADRAAFAAGLANAPGGRGLADEPPASASAAPAPAAPAGRPARAAGEKDYWDPTELTPDESGSTGPAAAPSAPASLIQAPRGPVNAPLAPADATAARRTAMAGMYDPATGPLPAPPPVPGGGPAGTGAQPMAPAPIRGASPVPAPVGAGARPAPVPPTPIPPVAAPPTAAPPPAIAPQAGPLPQPGPPPSETPKLTKRQREIDTEYRYYENLGRFARTPGDQAVIQSRMRRLENEYREIAAERKEERKDQDEGRKEVTKTEIEARKKLIETSSKDRAVADDIDQQLDAAIAIVDHPNYISGAPGAGLAWLGNVIGGINETLKFASGGKAAINENFMQNWISDPTARRENVESISNAITHRSIGTLSSGTNNADRVFVQRENINTDMSKEGIKRKAEMHKANNARVRQIHTIITQGTAEGKSHTQIQARLRRFGEENPIYKDKDGNLTPLGRRISPQQAAEEDRKRAAENKKPGRVEVGPLSGPADLLAEGTSRMLEPVAKEIAGDIAAGQKGAKWLLRESPISDVARRMGPIGPNVGTIPGITPQRTSTAPASRLMDTSDPGFNPSSAGVVDQYNKELGWTGRLAPGGIPWEAYRRSENVENRPLPGIVDQRALNAFEDFASPLNPNRASIASDTSPEVLRKWQDMIANMQSSTSAYENEPPPPRGPLNAEGGLADLESGRRQLPIAEIERRRGRDLAMPFVLPPLPRPKPRRREERR